MRRNLRKSSLLLAALPALAAPAFHRDIAPILYRYCTGCHHAGEVAPFPLLSYDDAAKRAKLIAAVTAQRTMPPWQPEPGYNRFADERRLTAAQIAAIQQWAAAGAPEGDVRAGPAAPVYNSNGWAMGEPDLIMRMPKPFEMAADGDDQYMCFAVPLRLAKDRYVRAMEFRPSNRRVVHHALFFTGHAPAASYPCFGLPGFIPTAGLGGWTPGMGPVRMPEGTAALLNAGTDLVLQLHFHATGKLETEQASIGFYFASTPPVRKVMDVGLTSKRIDIPAGVSNYKVTDHFTIPVPVTAIGVIPHAHYVCKEMRGWAVLPDGSKKWLLYIRDWNFNWQDQFRYAAPIHLPEDTRVEMEFTYDNSQANIRNPNSPPRRVVWGPGTADEMAGLHLQVIPDHVEDMPELGRALWGKIMRSVGGEFYRKPE
jgi:hypothetical protein